MENPKELSTAFTYSRKLTNDLSIGGSARYIWSNLTGSISNYSDAKAGNSFSVDLGIYYNKEISLVNRTSELSFGSHISNIGGKITYGSSKSLDFIPVNLRVGTSLKTFLDQYNSITLAVDLNKLMVPSPPIYEVDINGNYVIDPTTNQAKILKGKNPNRSVLSGIFSSFSDAPDGFSEEIKEVTISTGLEYWYREIFSFRGGYFLENMDKGGRKFLTLGLGIKYNNLGIDFSYLSTPQNDHPLAETMRFSLSFLFDKVEDADNN